MVSLQGALGAGRWCYMLRFANTVVNADPRRAVMFGDLHDRSARLCVLCASASNASLSRRCLRSSLRRCRGDEALPPAARLSQHAGGVELDDHTTRHRRRAEGGHRRRSRSAGRSSSAATERAGAPYRALASGDVHSTTATRARAMQRGQCSGVSQPTRGVIISRQRGQLSRSMRAPSWPQATPCQAVPSGVPCGGCRRRRGARARRPDSRGSSRYVICAARAEVDDRLPPRRLVRWLDRTCVAPTVLSSTSQSRSANPACADRSQQASSHPTGASTLNEHIT